MLSQYMALELENTEFEGKEYEEIKEQLYTIITDKYEEKMKQLNAEQRSEVHRVLYLQVLDTKWREHLYEIDVLKTGIGLRGYNQKDPLTEYKKESYEMFMDLISRIKHESTKTLQLIQLRDESQEKEREEAMAKMMQEMEKAAENVELSHKEVLQPSEQKAEKKVARNDPCPCGSGQKYKNCCGKSGPKKGLLAK
jgi:preprotein translocase subunit SecA